MISTKNQWKLLAAGLFMAFGRYPISWLLSSSRNIKKPGTIASRVRGYLSCKSGNTYYLEIDGKENAQTIIFLHGLNGSSLQWYYQRAYFRKNYKLIFIDFPGHGKSPLAKSMDTEILANDLGNIIDLLGIENPIIYGHSMGGMVTMKFAAKFKRTDIKALVIQHSGFSHPFRTTQFPKTMLALEHPVIRPYLALARKFPVFFKVMSMMNYLNGLSSIFYRYLIFSGEQTPAQLRFMTRIGAINPPEGVADAFLKLLDFEVTQQLKNINVPALIMTAEHDRILRPYAGAFIASQIEDGIHQQVASGHLSLVEHAVEINVIVNDFLESSLLNHDADQLA